MAHKRTRVKQTTSFEERPAEAARQFTEVAYRQPLGSKERKLLLRRARQAETACRINNWMTSPELQPPK